MQSRRKKYSVVNRGGVAPSPFVDGSAPSGISMGGGLDVPVGQESGLSPRVNGLLNEVEVVVNNEPGASSSMLQLESRLQKSSVYSMYQDNQSGDDRIEMRLLLLDESQRSQMMHKLVVAFQQKVLLCFDHFKPELTLACLRILTSLSALKPHTKNRTVEDRRSSETGSKTPEVREVFSELDVEEALKRELPNFTISRLRSTVQQVLRRASLRQDGSLYFAQASQCAMATRSVQYFVWFFDFMDYLQELYMNFNDKIFSPLYKYFYDNNFLIATGRTNTMSSAFSKLSQFSGSESMSTIDEADCDSVGDCAQLQKQSKASLLQLSKEYKDIKSIYDTSDMDKIAQRLSFVKDQLEYLFDEEDEIDPEFYSEESGKMVEHLDMDFGTENLIRLVPDILVKLKKAAWLANRWLDLDDQRTKDVGVKLDKLSGIEKKLKERLACLGDNIARGERKLERETNELSRLMEKEGRPDKLTFNVFNLESHIDKLRKKLDKLNKERETFAPRLAEVVKSRNLREMHRLKYCFESNKLQRFLTERKLATLGYQRDLIADDLNVEMYVRPSVIHSTNKLQDDCERLEQDLRDQRDELVNIRQALVPVQEDRASLMDRVSREKHREAPWLNDPNNTKLNNLLLYPGQALYVRSLPVAHGGRLSRRTKPGSRLSDVRRFPVDNSRLMRTLSPPRW
ncbi:uncharacterized protein LOC106012128 [Aplysia californica]|uniref:Uncharacterized protein LOC106012128 n=1 Tax=Aplysia californica TaxID=6500 RepID=A0ABM1A2G1_APLCA|nr:uncharacterized protein LOC106012128 [Aplysia californica]